MYSYLCVCVHGRTTHTPPFHNQPTNTPTPTTKTPKHQVANPLFSRSPATVALTRLLKLAIVDSLTEFAYPAALAGLSFDLDFTVKGLRLTVGGYHDKLPDFAVCVFGALWDGVCCRCVSLEKAEGDRGGCVHMHTYIIYIYVCIYTTHTLTHPPPPKQTPNNTQYNSAIAQRLAAYRGPQSDGDFARYKDLVTRELEGFDSLQPYMHAG